MRQLLIACFLVSGCVAASPESAGEVGSIAQAIGEPMNGFPTPEERLGIMAINRARSDPTTVKGAQSTVFPARPPILWNYDLSRSSRFHAINLQSSKVSLMHSSPCTLNANVGTSGCDGTTACACSGAIGNACANCANAAPVNNCGTMPFTRIGYFSNIATGEVAAAGYSDTWATVLGWVDEAAGSDGHRRNLLDQGITSNTMGFGHSAGAGCWSSFDVSDSGNQGGLSIPEIPSAAVQPARPTTGKARFWATWYDANSGAPQALNVVVDGQCTSLQKELGQPNLNSTWYADVQLGAGCHTWYILGKDQNGGRVTYPTNGALQSGSGCGSDYTAQQPAAPCDGNPPPPSDLSMPSMGKSDLSHTGPARDMAVKPGPVLDFGGSGAKLGVGQTCHAHADCLSNVCAFESVDTGYCTTPCDPDVSNSCPVDLVCGLIDNSNYCIQPVSGGGGSSGGCAVGRGGERGANYGVGILILALFGVMLRRRAI